MDPLDAILRPPAGETQEQKAARLHREAQAKAVSDQIDEQLKAEKELLKKRKNSGADVKLLLLGQAESGKSTLQKQFQLLHAPASLESERLSWRPVVFLNIINAVRTILDTLANPYPNSELDNHNNDYLTDLNNRTTGLEGKRGEKADLWARELDNLRLRLAPLLSIQEELARRIGGGWSNEEWDRADGYGHIDPEPTGVVMLGGVVPMVRNGWQSVFRANRKPRRSSSDSYEERQNRASMSTMDSGMTESNARMLEAFTEDIIELWHHPSVRAMLRKRKLLKLEDSAEFFLDEIERIASPYYMPSVDDILRARLQTLGVAEHNFETNIGRKTTWRLYDVGGSRGQRHCWIPFFDDANAIIFMAPISAFDQYLEEDQKVNRIDDSLQTFSQICSNPLLATVHLVLFLNKTDILKQKLLAGVKVKKYITSFGDRPNEYHEVSSYFRAHFHQVHRKSNTGNSRRVLYTHMTSVVDTKTTQVIITDVRDSIFRGYLKEINLV